MHSWTANMGSPDVLHKFFTSAPTRTVGMGCVRIFPTAERGSTTAPQPCWSTNAQNFAVDWEAEAGRMMFGTLRRFVNIEANKSLYWAKKLDPRDAPKIPLTDTKIPAVNESMLDISKHTMLEAEYTAVVGTFLDCEHDLSAVFAPRIILWNILNSSCNNHMLSALRLVHATYLRQQEDWSQSLRRSVWCLRTNVLACAGRGWCVVPKAP